MAFASPRLAFVVILVVNCILWSSSFYGHLPGSPHPAIYSPHKRSSFGVRDLAEAILVEDEAKCRPIAVPVEDQCTLVQEACAASDTFLSIPYLQSYFCSTPAARPLAFASLLLWLIFLFSTLGISASDFFCPNLATLAQLLGLDENVAGVTFLAFGNGSPDVFSTFSAMRANSGSLAIGELLGAASFIVSCVVGSMCMIKPFKVNRGPFLRDVGFFTVSVALVLAILFDGSIHAWEAGLLVALYLVYVVTVVVGSWWDSRRQRSRHFEAQIRDEYAEDSQSATCFDDEPYRDDPSPARTATPSLLDIPHPTRTRSISHPTPPRLDIQTDVSRPIPSRSGSHPPLSQLPSFSLVGALEFRHVIASLQNQSAGSQLNIFESPLAPYPGGHYHRFRSSSRPRTPVSPNEDQDSWDPSLGVPLNDRHSPQPLLSRSLPVLPPQSPLLVDFGNSGDDNDVPPIPTISHTPASPTIDNPPDPEGQSSVKLSRRQRVFNVVSSICHTLFPTFLGFRSKSVLAKIAAVFAAPAVFALTITLPVIVMPYDNSHSHYEKSILSSDPLLTFEEEGIERALIAEEEVQEELHHLGFSKWLMATQCVLGPLFSAGVLFKNMQYQGWLLFAVGLAGLASGALVVIYAETGNHPAARLARCSMGFFVAMVWIMAIADEVVSVLQTFGFIFGLSDAIIGLTIFAVGNSLADLVANMSVAVFAPIMGFSACFGGPMLNMLLGIGVSGSYMVHKTGKPYLLDFSTTLLVSSIGLLALLIMTIIFVPMNGYFLPRRWGAFLVVCYVLIMAINVAVEVVSH
ncbi:Sodium/calcium exchanger protein-domain-containing protein [Amylostereum chailletii]|nr:Sodium/calcium exchanger protein-domain-containing protein [Amylostereum chailletii]